MSDAKGLNRGDVGRFFDQITGEYAEVIQRCFPRYPEMLQTLLEYLPERRYGTILELGCGTGNLSVLLNEIHADAQITLVDISSESLETCRSRLNPGNRVSFVCDDFRNLDFSDQSFDLVLSSISIHHLPEDEKRRLFEKVLAWLRPQGVFSFADQFSGEWPSTYQQHQAKWKKMSLDAGSTVDEWNMWMEHQAQHDFHDPLMDQIDWLRKAGFTSVDCTWRYLLWAIVICERAGT